MTELEFTVSEIVPDAYAATPQLLARLHISESTGAVIHAIALRCQVRILAQRRTYTAEEESGLLDLFGPRARWPSTLRPFMWLQCSTMVQGFTDGTDVDLVLPCTFDFDVTASKYLHALREKSIPIELLFSGTVFTRGANGFGVEQVPWNLEATYQFPVIVWRELIDQYFPNTGWIRVNRDVMDELSHYRSALGLASWEATFEALLAKAGDRVS